MPRLVFGVWGAEAGEATTGFLPLEDDDEDDEDLAPFERCNCFCDEERVVALARLSGAGALCGVVPATTVTPADGVLRVL